MGIENPDVRLVREALESARYSHGMEPGLAALNRLEARIAEQDARWQEMDHPYNKSEVDALHARIAELERELTIRDSEIEGLQGAYGMAEARAERYAEALRWYDDHKSQDGSYDGDLFGDLNAVGLAEQPPAENTGFEWKTQEC